MINPRGNGRISTSGNIDIIIDIINIILVLVSTKPAG